MYDPITARFLQEDIYTGDPNDPLSLDLYTYCANNPLIYFDPTGHNQERIEVINRQIEIRKEYIKELQKEIKKLRGNKDFGRTWQAVIDKQNSVISDLYSEKIDLLLENIYLEDVEVEVDIDLSPWDNDEPEPGYFEQIGNNIVDGAMDRHEAITEGDGTVYDWANYITFGWYEGVNDSFWRLMEPKYSLDDYFTVQNIADGINVGSAFYTAGQVGNAAGNAIFGTSTPVLNGGGASTSPAKAWSMFDDAANVGGKTTLDYLDDITVMNGKCYASKDVIDDIGIIEAKGTDFSKFNKSILSSRPSTEGGLSQVIKYSDEKGVRFIIHEVTDGAGSIIHRDFDAVMIESGHIINKALK